MAIGFHPRVRQCARVGMTQRRVGQTPCAFMEFITRENCSVGAQGVLGAYSSLAGPIWESAEVPWEVPFILKLGE